MEIKGYEIIAGDNKYIYRKSDTRFETPIRRATIFKGETIDDFDEYDELQAVIQREEKPEMEAQMLEFARMTTRTMTDIPDETAAKMPDCFDAWNTLIGETLEKGRIVNYDGKIYRTLQQHTAQANIIPCKQVAMYSEPFFEEINSNK